MNAEGENIEPADLAALAPVGGFFAIREGAIQAEQVDVADIADDLFPEQFPDKAVTRQTMRRRAEHRDAIRSLGCGSVHALGLGQIPGHARLAKHVLAVMQGRDGGGFVQVGRRADPNDVDIGVGDHFLPAPERLRTGGVFLTKTF